MAFETFLPNLIPLYVLIFIGWLAGRQDGIDRATLANLVLFVIMPVMVFGFVVKLELQPAYAFLPIVMYGVQAFVAGLFLKIGKKIYKDSTANLLALSASLGNFGYFGLPVVMLLFPPEMLGVYMFILLGNILFEATAGYYIAARGHFTVKDSLQKLARFPAIYAVILGLVVNLAHIQLPDQFFTYRDYFKGAYVVIGMMIIGVSLARMEKLAIRLEFIGLAFLGKFLLWPLIVFGLIVMDRYVTHVYAAEIRKLFFVLSVVPPAANIAAFAAQLNLKPEQAATTVLVGTLFAAFWIPLSLALLPVF